MHKLTPILLALLPLIAASQEDDIAVWQQVKPDVTRAVSAYIQKMNWSKDQSKWNKDLSERADASNRSIQDIALDWFFDCEKALKQEDPKALKTACFFFMRFLADDIPPPLQMRARMTKQNFDKLVKWLDDHSK
jgi:hypothetical protein